MLLRDAPLETIEMGGADSLWKAQENNKNTGTKKPTPKFH